MNTVNTTQITHNETNIHIIGTTHSEKKAFSDKDKCIEESNTILNTLEQLSFSTLFVELPPNQVKNISKFKDSSPAHSSVELVAIAKYKSKNRVNIIGVDSQSMRDLNTYDSSNEMKQISRLARNNTIAYNTLQHLYDKNIQNCVLIIGKHHMREVTKILSE